MYYCRVNISAIYSPRSRHGLRQTPCSTTVNIWIWQDDIGVTEHRRLQEAAGHLTTSHPDLRPSSQHRDHLISTQPQSGPAGHRADTATALLSIAFNSSQISRYILSTILRRVSSFNDNPLTGIWDVLGFQATIKCLCILLKEFRKVDLSCPMRLRSI